MHSLYRAIVVALITFGASLVGMALQWVVPADVLTASKGSVGAMVGLVTLLLALVLGLLVFTAFSVFTTQQSEAYSLGPMVAEVDLALELYGPEAAGGRAGLLAALQRSRVRFFGNSERGPQPFTFEEMRAIFLSQNGFFDSLKPTTEAQRGLVATARDQVRKLADTQMLMARQLANPFPPHVLTVVVSWASALFLGNGLVAAPSAGQRARASRRRGLHRDCDLSHPRTEPSLYGLDPPFARRHRPGDQDPQRPRRERGDCALGPPERTAGPEG